MAATLMETWASAKQCLHQSAFLLDEKAGRSSTAFAAAARIFLFGARDVWFVIGLLYQSGGMTGCLIGLAIMLASCWLITLFLPLHASGVGAAAVRPAE